MDVLGNWWWTEFVFTRKKWTEFTLYWSYVDYKQLTHLYSREDIIYGKSIWFDKEVSENTFQEILSDKNLGYFTVCQSTGVSDEVVFNMVERYLNLS